MPSTEESYRVAAKEHLERAQNLFNTESYYLAHYLGGLAIECHLRAWLRRRTDKFDSRHDLDRLAKESGFYAVIPYSQNQEFGSTFGTANERWRSNHRYYSERQLLDYMNNIRAEFNVSGNRWKNLARTLLNCARKVINQGEAKWNKQ
ncbi:MAG: HEPN domain-containing protein [Armatimonadetes bacterium]|nr:HEPN domain-containing protein [Armatimonadota bacterium]